MEVDTLPYDGDAGLPYDDDSGTKYAQEHPEHDFKNRIGAGRLYLLAESSAAMNGRLRRPRKDEEGPEDKPEEMALEDNAETNSGVPGVRDNAILFRGEPVANLPTQRIFAYVSHCGTPPLGLEWVNDTNVVLVWENVAEARNAYQSMREAGTLEMEEDDEGFVPARPIPETLAPMSLRLEKALGKATQEQGQIWMRWARAEDVKAKGGRNKSKFYEKYGEQAGKEGQNMFSSRHSGKRKRDDTEDDLRRKLDAELDGFADGDETTRRRSLSPRRGRSASPPRRDRDRRAKDGRRRHADYDYDRDLKSRLGPQVGTSGRPVREWDIGKELVTDEFGRSSFGRRDRDETNADEGRDYRPQRREGGGRKREGREPRATVTKEDLDTELDSFLKS